MKILPGALAMPVHLVSKSQGEGDGENPAPDVKIVTSGRRSIPVDSSILASMSPVLQSMLERPLKPGRSSAKVIPILGVPRDAVLAFVRFLYSSRFSENEEEVDKYGMHLLVLSHVYQVGRLKRACEVGLAARLTAETVVDVLQLARQCDASWLYLRGMKFLAKDFSSVEQTEAWHFLQANDPWLELEILQFLQESDSRVKRRRRKREQEQVYIQLSEAMECLQHICTEGCTDVGPCDGEPPSKSKGPCSKFNTCQGLQHLIKHFAVCDRKRTPSGCPRCKRMWQLFRLHSFTCDQPEPCKVPLCKQFKDRTQEVKVKGDEGKWEMLVRKVIAARVMTSLAKRHKHEPVHEY
ncbi:putative chromatin remodeling & transcription regulator BTB-POZ family [Dioscorea sansibarensis]